MKHLLTALFLVLLAGVLGCESDDAEPKGNLRTRQDRALNDPWNYSPHEVDRTDISGGGMSEFNKKAFKKDMDSVFNP